MSRGFFKQKKVKKLTALFLFYMNVIIFFAIIYWLLDWTKLGTIVDHFSTSSHQETLLDSLLRAFYMSSLTLLSVGYGDLTPFGLSRGVAVIEAMVGYILPAALVIQSFSNPEAD
ncbi:ion channel [Pullulanibacillus sp. KACC 23026]|uniref:ion channel n=1 Tax=Pullulanibacillus sp. KACC 23026 TaxID=3028315 RepID=UPI0023AF5A63|nr:ion channel [Pullulanibacillus sp. KACC 23026]WEG11287.1 ion channel [Pullulanibacillus sp. KACC 23026]